MTTCERINLVDMSNTTKAVRKQISVVIPVALHIRAKKAAASEQIFLSEFFGRAVANELKERAAKRAN